jgi:dipeptidyl-peptidase-4
MRLRLGLLLLLAPAFILAASEEPGLKFFRDLAETRNFTLGRPVTPRITPEGKAVIFLRSGPRDPTLLLYEFDLTTRRERLILTPAQLLGSVEEKLTPEEKARRERQRLSAKGFTSFQLSRDGGRVLVTLSGRLYLVSRATAGQSAAKTTALPGEGWIDPRFSPDGNFVAAAGPDRELHVIDLSSNTDVVVTHGATATISHGTAEFVAQEEMSRYEGYWWAPDSESLLCQETDETNVEVRYVSDPLHPESPPTRFFYPRAGSPNAVVRLLLVSRHGGRPLPVTWDHAGFPYLAGVRWSQANAPLTLLVQNRAQTDERLLAVDPANGKSRELLRETDSAWLNLDDNAAGSLGTKRPPFWFKDGSHFIWTTERRGTWQVELRTANGALVRELTPVTWNYRGFVGHDD